MYFFENVWIFFFSFQIIKNWYEKLCRLFLFKVSILTLNKIHAVTVHCAGNGTGGCLIYSCQVDFILNADKKSIKQWRNLKMKRIFLVKVLLFQFTTFRSPKCLARHGSGGGR